MSKQIVVVAGATGNLGGRIVAALIEKGTEVRVLARATSDADKLKQLEKLGATIHIVNMLNVSEITLVCKGADCVVSALAGLEDVVLDAQKTLLNGAVLVGVPRFIPSDYSLDFTKFNDGENRNLDLRRKFHQYMDKTGIRTTSVFNGAFMNMLTNEIPMIIFDKKLVLYWGDADHKLGFTTVADTAKYTANVALDPDAPRYLNIAGDYISPREIRQVMNDVSGQKFRLIRTGGLGFFSFIIKIAKYFDKTKTELYPSWQGMQYMRNMADPRAKMTSNDNNRYPNMTFTSVKDLIKEHKSK